MKTRTVAFSLGGAIVVCALAYAVSFMYTFDEAMSCDVEKQASTLSPDGKYVAVAFEIGCGATAGFNTQLSIAPSDEPFDPRRFPPALILDDKLMLHVHWTDNTRLVVRFSKGVREFKKQAQMGEVTITYKN